MILLQKSKVRHALLSAILPGFDRFAAGERLAGSLCFLSYLSLLALAIFSWDKIASALESNKIDEWIAVIFLFGMIASIWFSSVYQSVYSRQKNSDGSRDQWLIIWRDFKKNRLAIIGLICVLGFYAVALLAPLLAVADPNMQGDVVKTRYLSPSFDHPLGTDKFGRDIFSRLIYGSRISLSIGFVAVSISVVIGTAVGAISGYFGQMIDTVLMRFVDILLAFPRIFLVLALIAMYSNSLWLTMAVLGFTGWMGTSRIVRGQVLSIKEEGYILAAKALGMSHTRIIFRHILPNVLAPVIVVATLGIGNTILAESFLSYLGLSVQPPTPTWGNIIFQGQDNMLSAWWISTFPGIAIVFTALSYNLVGDGLRDALDPKLRNI